MALAAGPGRRWLTASKRQGAPHPPLLRVALCPGTVTMRSARWPAGQGTVMNRDTLRALRDRRRPGGPWHRPLPAHLHAVLRAARHHRPAVPLQTLFQAAGLPRPLWHPRLYLDGRWLASPVAYWPGHGVLLAVPGAPAAPDTASLCTVHVTPHRLRQAPRSALVALREALTTGPHGPWQRVTTRS